MVWWAEADSPATKSRHGRPGEILSVNPLVVATANGALELTKTEWRGVSAPTLQVGHMI